MPDKHGNITVSDVEEVMNGISGQRQAMTFDMQKARQYAETSPLMSHAPYIVALDEIERLIHLVDETVIQLGACRFVAKHIQNEQAKRIAELDAEAQSYHDRKEEFAGRIAELKESLVEERAARHRWRCIESDDDDWCEFPGSDEGCEGCSLPGKIRDEAREQLRREGVIR